MVLLGAETLFESHRSRHPLSCDAQTIRDLASTPMSVRASDRKRLESLCKYAARPPLAHERLQETSGGRLVYRMKTPWRSGQTHVVMERIELIEKLAALVPRPRYHIVHYYGVLAPAAKWRKDSSRSLSAGTMFT